MKLKQKTIQELSTILKEEYKIELSQNDLEKLAYTLIRYFSLLMKLEKK